MNIKKVQKGSALIIALLIMGVLMTLALGLSNLVIREVRITADIVNAGKAYYAAEAGTESALLDLHQNLPGYEVENAGMAGGLFDNNQVGLSENVNLDFDYSVENKTHVVPLVDTEIIDPVIVNDSPRMTYNVLDLNDTISMPLFIGDEIGSTKDVSSFRVEYFMDAEIDPRWSGNFALNNVDMLRWKITGIKKGTGEAGRLLTESIGDYIAIFPGSSENQPTCFGTEDSRLYSPLNVDGVIYEENCTGNIYKYAREAYTFDIDNQTGEIITLMHLEEKNTQMYIKDFITNHSHNYLTITNIFNPSILAGFSSSERRNKAKIYYRIIIPKEDEYTIREYAKISSTGLIGKLRQKIEALIRPDRFMPVFNFSLYRTDVGSEKETPEGFTQEGS